jgi:hypothetical protein
MPDSLAAVSPSRLQTAKEFGLAEWFSAVSMTLCETSASRLAEASLGGLEHFVELFRSIREIHLETPELC